MTGAVVWVTGLPSAGKSTFAARLCAETGAILLDGDDVRDVLRPRPGYDDDARAGFYETLGGLAALLARQGHVVVVAATAQRASHRERARGAPRYFEVFVDVPPDECARRDAKGLYAAVRRGDARGLPGVDVEYEIPRAPHVVAQGGHDDAARSAVRRLLERRET